MVPSSSASLPLLPSLLPPVLHISLFLPAYPDLDLGVGFSWLLRPTVGGVAASIGAMVAFAYGDHVQTAVLVAALALAPCVGSHGRWRLEAFLGLCCTHYLHTFSAI